MRAILAISLFAMAGTAQAGFYTGNDLHELCKADQPAVLGYVAGVIDKSGYDLQVLEALDNAPAGDIPTFSRKYRMGGFICYPDGMVLRQARDIFCKYLADHPESRQKGAEGLVQAALYDAWPCK
ncbi:Rap1a/Tai family immunity protein [Rhizobium sp. Nf11,1]|uniref:Rap1a/Tai family immunity protein n=1 Tax=Rhizobium sp. Nf11,1 TaxID=3404923 RepID=UPI003D344FEA